MKAIILAAGRGKRLGGFTEENHKSMAEIDGKSLLEHSVESLNKVGFKEIVIVVGYLGDKIKSRIGDSYNKSKIIYVDNNEFVEKGNLHSLYLAKEHFDQGFIVLDADLIFDSRIIKELVDSEHSNALLLGPLDVDTGEEVKVYSQNGKLTKLGKQVDFFENEILEGESIGIMKISKEAVSSWISHAENKLVISPKSDHEEIIHEWCEQGNMDMVKTDKAWLEIDFQEDLDKARNEIYPKILKEEPGRSAKKKFKVLLIHANSTMDTLIPPNLSIMAAVLKQANIQVELFDTTFYKTRDFTGDDARVKTLQVQETNFEKLGIYLTTTDMGEDFIKKVQEYKPDIIGLSAVELTYPFGIKLLRKLRDESINTTTIVGGIHATLSPEEVLNEDCVDYVCVGEGEYAFKELCEALRDNLETTKISNIWIKKDGEILKNSIRPPVNLDDLPFQDWEMFNKQRLYKPMGGKIRRTGCFELNRGCPYSCTYCCNEFFHKMYKSKHYRERSVRKFIDEVKFMKEKYNLEFIYISAESLLSTKEERFQEFVKLWKEEINLPFWAETRPESVTLERAKLLENAGCVSMSIGLESGSLEVRKMLNRHMTNERVIQSFKDLKQTNLRIGANSIIGFPDETREQIFETIELNRQINVDNSMVHVFNPYRGTQLFDYCVKKGYISRNTLGGDYRADAMLKMPQLSQDEIMGLQRTFALYVKLPKKRWPEIKMAEKFDEIGNAKFEELKKEYTETYFNISQKKIKKIMLINPSSTILKDSVRRMPTPLGLMYIGATLKNEGYEVEILDSPCEGYENTFVNGELITYGLNDEQFIKRVKDFAPDIIGITSMFSAHQNNAIHYCDLIKSIDSSIKIILGGIHPSLWPEKSIKEKSADFVIIGEGEFRIVKLLNQLNEGKVDFEIDGIAYKKENEIIIKPRTTWIEELDDTPLPARELIDMKKYIKIGVPYAPFPRKERVEQVMTSRGCPFNCVFCSTVKYWGRKFRMRSVDNILKEIEFLINQYGIEEIQFTDDNMTVHRERAIELFKRLKDYNIAWCAPHGLMMQTIDEEMVKLMAESGAYQLTFAIESGSERVLQDIIHKPVPSKEKVKKIVQACQKYGIQVHGLFVVGFPSETREELDLTFQYPFDIGFDSVSFFIANPIPGSELYDRCKRKGYLLENPKLELKKAEINIPLDSPDYTISKEELEKLVDDKTREFNEFSKQKYPDRWDKKFQQFLKRHGDKADLLLGRVT